MELALNQKNSNVLKLSILYLLLVAGGVWHVLGVFQDLMRLAAGPLIAILTIWMAYEYWKETSVLENTRSKNQIRIKFSIWLAFVFIGSILLENIGVKTGLIFGTYEYGNTLWPRIDTVPAAIGFSWINMLLGSIAIVYILSDSKSKHSIWMSSFLVALLMVGFDIIMEPAAMHLDYWNWQGGQVPVQNYLAWFVLGWIFAFSGYALGIFRKGVPRITQHAFYDQLIYFSLVNISRYTG